MPSLGRRLLTTLFALVVLAGCGGQEEPLEPTVASCDPARGGAWWLGCGDAVTGAASAVCTGLLDQGPASTRRELNRYVPLELSDEFGDKVKVRKLPGGRIEDGRLRGKPRTQRARVGSFVVMPLRNDTCHRPLEIRESDASLTYGMNRPGFQVEPGRNVVRLDGRPILTVIGKEPEN